MPKYMTLTMVVEKATPEYAKESGKSEKEAAEDLRKYLRSFLDSITIGGKRHYPVIGPSRGIIRKLTEEEFEVLPLPPPRKVRGRFRKKASDEGRYGIVSR